MPDERILELEDIDEVGERRAEALREAGFGTVAAVRAASVRELSAVEGISRSVAEAIKTDVGEVLTEFDEDMVRGVRERWRLYDWRDWWWLPRRATVRILMYADGSVGFRTNGFTLKHVLETLDTDPYHWVRFDVTTVHRDTDPTADMDQTRLTDVDLSDYDELWLFGIYSGRDPLDDAELSDVETFMNEHDGGVLVTGDHASLGEDLAGAVVRAGDMRKYPAPPSSAGAWNNTLREGPDPGYQFNDQSDDVPQNVRLRTYPAWSAFPYLSLNRRPHPILCGPEGPIDVFPDHQHEGEVAAPDSYPTDVWPEKNGFQPKVEFVAWGRILSPDADVGREFPIVGVYEGHAADVGRIVADSTWHHWFDVNLTGFETSQSGTSFLKQIEAYFMNVAIWLAPPGTQRRMRNALYWGGIWRDPLVMVDPKALRFGRFGSMAYGALGQYAPQCLIQQWVHDLLELPKLRRLWELQDEFPVPIPIEEYVVGEAVESLIERFEQDMNEAEYPGDDALDEAFEEAVPRAVERLSEESEKRHERVREFTGQFG